MNAIANKNEARINGLDVLRGFAVGGILFANILWLSGYLLAADKVQKAQLLVHPLDEFFLFFTRLLVHGKFYAIFSFLFGLGFSIQLLRAQNKSKPGFVAQFGRRMVFLFLIGWLHAWFLWWGDILRFYACLGVFLLLLSNKSDLVILITAGAALLAPMVLAMLHQSGLPQITDTSLKRFDKYQAIAALSQGGWETFYDFNWQRIKYHAASNIENGRVFKIFGLFCLGFYLGRQRVFSNVEKNRQKFRQALLWGGVVGGLFSLIRVAQIYKLLPDTDSEILEECFYLLSVYPLAFAYMAGIILVCNSSRLGNHLAFLAPVGQMALSNYLLQSLACALIFQWWGFGLAGSLPLRDCFALVVSLFVIQIVLSRAWLKHFNHGPIEWCWRACTQLEMPPLLRLQTVHGSPFTNG